MITSMQDFACYVSAVCLLVCLYECYQGIYRFYAVFVAINPGKRSLGAIEDQSEAFTARRTKI